MNYGGYDNNPFNYDDGGSTMVSDHGNALRNKIIRGQCRTGTLRYQHHLNLDVYASSSVEADIPLSLDESYCISCISVQPGNTKSTLSFAATNGGRGVRSTLKLTATGSRDEEYEFLQLIVKVYQVRKTGQFCN